MPIIAEVNMWLEECCKCHMQFGMTLPFRNKMLEDGGDFYWPQGQGQSFTKPKIPELEKRLQWATEARDRASGRAERLENSNRGLRGAITRLKRKKK